jgi:hypothetical protein
MINDVGPSGRSEQVIRRAPVIMFPTQYLDPEYETKFASIRWVVWCFVVEVGISIGLFLAWRLWLAYAVHLPTG